MTPKTIEVLQVASLTPAGNRHLADNFNVVRLWEQEDRERFLKENGQRFNAVATAGIGKIDADLLANLPALEIISSRGVGYEHIDLGAAKQRNIVVCNTPGVLTDCVADLAFGALIALARAFVPADQYLRAGKWLENTFPLQTRVSGKKLAITGLGRIGRTIARRASGFDMDIRYTDLQAHQDVSFGYEESLLDLARWADFLIVTTPGGEATRKLISKEVMEALGPEGLLVNISRGTVVDEQALIGCLKDGTLGGAALDVFEQEPNVPQELIALDNVLLLPHIGSATRETRKAMEDLVVDNLSAYFKTGEPLTPIR